jgi:hypothetical protein
MSRGSYAHKSNPLATPYQRLTIRCLMDKIELPWDYATQSNMDLLSAAGIALPELGARFDGVLAALTREQAISLIRVLHDKGATIA